MKVLIGAGLVVAGIIGLTVVAVVSNNKQKKAHEKFIRDLDIDASGRSKAERDFDAAVASCEQAIDDFVNTVNHDRRESLRTYIQSLGEIKSQHRSPIVKQKMSDVVWVNRMHRAG